jgi:hypothetical protein
MIKFPYGICDFYKIITNGYYYADRTDRIRQIEAAGDHLLFLRPRRFGKSLLLSTLENYYDASKAGEFEKLFGHLAAGKNPTPLHSRYFVLIWDFSAVSVQGDIGIIRKSLHDHINGCIEIFAAHYADMLDYQITIEPDNALRSFLSVLAAVRRTPYKLCLLIDEYDNFANEIMSAGGSEGEERCKELLYGDGELKTIFKAVKSAARGQGLDRTFITGVSPVVMSDITSGHNISENISLMPEFNDICGFTEPEIQSILRHVIEECGLPEEKLSEALDMMRTFYNGYSFRYDSQEMIHNPTLAIYFLKHLQKECAYPQKMLDSNLAPDRGKIAYISGLPSGKTVIADALSGEKTVTVSELSDRFGIKDILCAPKDEVFAVSLLYYFGVLTLSGTRTPMGKNILEIPNLVIRKLYAEQMREMLVPALSFRGVSEAAEAFCQYGNIQPLCEFAESRCFPVFDNRDYLHANELAVKTLFLALLYSDTFYIMDSETPVERRYADLTMIVRPDMRRYELLDLLIEFKYTGIKKTGLSGEEIRQMSRAELEKLPAVREKLDEAEMQAAAYGKKLEEIYGGILQLRRYAVVAVGFERLVWREIFN